MANEKKRSKNRLTELRQRGIVLSQEQVGILTGLDSTTVSRHESGARGMTREQIEAYAKLYGVPTHEVFFLAPVLDSEDGAEVAAAGQK